MLSKIYPLRLIPDKTNFNFMEKRWIGFSLTIMIMVISLISFLSKGLNLGIDFTGGVLIEASMPEKIDISNMRHVLNNLHIGEVSLQNISSDKDVLIRIGEQASSKTDQMKTVELIKNTISEKISPKVEYRKIDYVGPQVGGELIKNGIYAMIFSFLAIMIYIWIRFEWQYGVGLLSALVHDAIAAIGFMSITQLEFNLTSIAAILTIIGYSVNDSVVIYDRIRENMRKYKKITIVELINKSINDTLSRTILTVMTTLLSTLALIFYGGEAIKSFSLVVFFGIIVGTYSSIYISAPILIYLSLNKQEEAKSKS